MRILENFAAELDRRRVRLHGAVLMQGGKVIDELYRHPYDKDTKTRMYSSTKSIAAIAIGKLVGEGRLSLDDKVVDIFRDRFDMSDVHPLLREQTVRQMLTMTTALSDPAYNENTSDWLASYFRAKPTHPAGTVWYYDSSGSYVIGAITKHLTGLDFVQYLRPEFDIMGVSEGVYALQGPDGEAWASSGLMCTTTDIARMGYLLLNGGKWGDNQLIPEDYARDAISPLVRNDDGGGVYRFNCGYGYQIWSHPDGCFAFRGLGGQIVIGYPGRDLVFSCNLDASCHVNAYIEAFEAAERVIAPAFPITDVKRYEAAQRPPVSKNALGELIGKTYRLEENPMNIERIAFSGDKERTVLTYTRGGVEREIAFSTEKSIDIIFPEKYSGLRLFTPRESMNYRCSVEAEWIEERKLHIRVWAEDVYVGNMSMCFALTPDGRLAVKMEKHAQFFFDGFQGYAWGSPI